MSCAPRVLVAPDSFKGTLTAGEVADALAAGLREAGCVPDRCPVADGGEGTLAILAESLGGELRAVRVHGPLGAPVAARFALLPAAGRSAGRTAIVEMAEASGLGLVPAKERDPVRASTTGTGELIAAAVAAGATEVHVTVGGSATTDGGAGACAAIEASGGLRGARLVVLADVVTPFERAAEVYGPQKGADAAAVRRLTGRLHELAASFPRDPRGVPMSGAAGGLAGGLWACFDAELRAGAPAVLDVLGFDASLRAADAVVVGEGRIDGQSFDGKVVGEIARRATRAGVPVHAVVGSDALKPGEAAAHGLASVRTASDPAALTAAAREVVLADGRIATQIQDGL